MCPAQTQEKEITNGVHTQGQEFWGHGWSPIARNLWHQIHCTAGGNLQEEHSKLPWTLQGATFLFFDSFFITFTPIKKSIEKYRAAGGSRLAGGELEAPPSPVLGGQAGVGLWAPGRKVPSPGKCKALEHSSFERKRSMLDTRSRIRGRKGYWYYIMLKTRWKLQRTSCGH